MLTRNLADSLGNHVRRATSGCFRWNYGLRTVLIAAVLVVLLLSAASCGGGSAKSSTAKKHAAQRGLYIISTKTGTIDESFPDIGVGNYVRVNAVVSDSSGGWYVAGSFNRIGEVRRNGLARLRSDGTVDPGFAPRLPKQTPVVGVVRHGNTVFIDTVPSAKKHGYRASIVAAFDAASGRRLWQVPAEGVSGSGYLAFVNGGSGNLAFANGTLFVGGFETMRVAGIPRSGLAALDPKTGKPTSWHVHLASGRKAQGDVEAMSIENGAIYYVGYFKGTETYRGDKGLGAISIHTGGPTPWNPEPTNDLDEATAILATHGQVLAGGNGFAVFDARSGRVVPWYKHLKYNANSFAVSGKAVYLGAVPNDGSGILVRAGGKRVHNLAAVVLPSGRVTNWRPMPSPIPYVRALAVSGQNVLVCG